MKPFLSPRWGWVGFLTHPTAYAVGYILEPLRGCESSMTTLGSYSVRLD